MENTTANERLFSRIDSIITDENTDVSGLPLSAPCTAVSSGEDMQSALNTVLSERQAKAHVLIITDSEGFKDVILALNKTIRKGKLSVLCNYRLYAEEAMKEIVREEALLFTEDGTEFFPEKPIGGTDRLFADENGRLFLKGSTEGRPVYSKDGTCRGCILDDERYTLEGFKGRLTDNLSGLDIRSKAEIAKKLLDIYENNGEMLPEADNIMLFSTPDSDTELLAAGEPAQCSRKRLAELLSRVYLGNETDCKDKLEMLIKARLSMPELPAFLFEDLLSVYAWSVFPSVSSCSLPSLQQLRNTAERILTA